MGEPSKRSELDEILTLDQVRESLGEVGKGLSFDDLEPVRLQAAEVLGKISDAELRSRSAVGIVRNKWQQLSQTEGYPTVKAAYYRAKQLFLKVNGGRDDLEFYNESCLESPRSMAALRTKLANQPPLDQHFSQVAAGIERIIERFGPAPIGQRKFFLSGDRIRYAQISCVTKDGHICFKGGGGSPGLNGVRNTANEIKERAIFESCRVTKPLATEQDRYVLLKHYEANGIPQDVLAEWCMRAHTKFLELNGEYFPEMNVSYDALSPEDRANFEENVHLFVRRAK